MHQRPNWEQKCCPNKDKNASMRAKSECEYSESQFQRKEAAEESESEFPKRNESASLVFKCAV
jgi:hypothetical protein